MKLRLLIPALLASVGLALAGCGGSGSEPAGSGDASSPAAAAVTVDTMFGAVTIPAPEDGTLDVVALGWSDAEMALAVGVKPVAVFDWQSFGEPNKGVGPWATSLFGDVKPTVIPQTQQTLNYEQIQSLNPDVILNVRAANDKATYDRLSEIAPTVYAPADTPAFATDWEVQLATIGKALSKSEEATKVAADVNAKIKAAASPDFKDVKVASAAKFGDAYGAYLPGDGRFDILGDLGFVNNPPIESLQSNGFFATVPAEKISTLDTDVTIIQPIGFTLAQTKADPLIASLKVVKDGRAIFLDPDSELYGAWGASSALSIPVVLDQLTPQLTEAVEKLG